MVFSIKIVQMAVQNIIKIDIALMSWLNQVKAGIHSIDVEFVSGKSWYELQFTPGTGDFSEKSKNSEAGVSYTSELKCNIPGDREDILNDILNLENRELMVRFAYNTGEIKVIGIPDFPVKMTSDLSVNKSGLYKLTFSCDSIYRARFQHN